MALLQFTVSNLTQPERLDSYVASNQNITRSRLKQGVISIKVNGKESKLSAKLKGEEEIEISFEDPVPEDILPENIPLDILYEDDNVTVVNKFQGMVTHPGAGNWTGTLVNALLYHWGKSSENLANSEKADGEQKSGNRPGIVHRLDKDTSGVIITGKNREAEEWLQGKFYRRKVYKEYIAIVKGKPPRGSGEIKTQIVRDPKNRKRFIATEDKTKGKFAHTDYVCLGVYGGYSLMRLKLHTGRTHQIRVHLKHIGCPILGDPIYARKDNLFPDATLMLHARVLGIKLPTGEKKFFVAPVPKRFKKVLAELRKNFKKWMY
jgi:23S rRNA pseudouridine1911/1915/1917 synthase